MCSEEVLTLYCSDDYRKAGGLMLLGPCRTYRTHGFLEIKHLLQMGSDMLGRAASLDCTGLWDEVKISCSAPAISFILQKETSSVVDFLILRRGSIHQQWRYQRTGKIWQQTRGEPGTRKM